MNTNTAAKFRALSNGYTSTFTIPELEKCNGEYLSKDECDALYSLPVFGYGRAFGLDIQRVR